MKKSKHQFKFIAIAVALYLLIFIVGLYFFAVFPAREHLPRLYETAKDAVAEYNSNGVEHALILTGGAGGTRTLIFDADGTCIYYIIPDGVMDPAHDDLGEYSHWQIDLLSHSLSSVLEGNELQQTIFHWSPSQETMNALAFVGLPLMEDGVVVGALLRVKNDSTIFVSVQIFLVLYACIGVILVLVFLFMRQREKEQKKLTQIKNNYVANVTHTLKTPLASIKAMAEALSDEVVSDPDKQKVYYGRILLESKKLERTILDILELSALQTRETGIAKQTTVADDCFMPVLENYQELCECLNINFHISEKLTRLPPLYTNVACIQKVLEILLDNAVKFSNGSDIWIDATIAEKSITVCVNDRGLGIQKEDILLVFERFFKRGGAINESGSGLGLAIAKETLLGLNEEIWVDSNQTKGTSFYFTIQRAPSR